MKSCLVVDDSSVIRKVARRILEDLSFTITEAEDGQQALERCQAEMPDAILLDWNMPVMDGLEFLAQLRQLQNGEKPKDLPTPWQMKNIDESKFMFKAIEPSDMEEPKTKAERKAEKKEAKAQLKQKKAEVKSQLKQRKAEVKQKKAELKQKKAEAKKKAEA